ncbi:hypothetical protein SPHN_00760 [Sphingomonas faeni]|nr:hypothetical protein [Sphingomonas faeni]
MVDLPARIDSRRIIPPRRSRAIDTDNPQSAIKSQRCVIPLFEIPEMELTVVRG